MTNRLTKAFLGGIKHIETVELVHPATGDKVTVQVRPLSDGESHDIRGLLAGGLELSGDPTAARKDGENLVKGDLSKITESQALAARKAVARAIVSDDKWTEAEIAAAWPPGWVADLAKTVYRISGIQVSSPKVAAQEAAEEDTFRGVSSGPGVADPQ
ncbi:MAG: hypothetical protein HPY55_06545 [Firmicutes bacterium]|nr:hypothetical protein [Bacillota bacterium]